MLQKIGWLWCASLLLMISLAGCRLPGRNPLEQCRSESEQLLNEYRQQRDRAERLEIENRTLHEQIASVEKQLALASEGGEERLAVRPEMPVSDATEQGARPSQAKSADAAPPSRTDRSTVAKEEPSAMSSPDEETSPPEDGWRGVPRP